jgi:hypothetical protein
MITESHRRFWYHLISVVGLDIAIELNFSEYIVYN